MARPRFGNGAIIGDDQIAVDYWYPSPHVEAPKIHFLTHLHADHIDGLTRTWTKPIYTSETNCKLVSKFVPGLKSHLLRPLKMNEEIKIPLPGAR